MSDSCNEPWPAFLVLDRLVSDDAGESRFVRTRVPQEPDTRADQSVPWVPRSIKIASNEVAVRCLPAGFDLEHSHVPERRLIVMMTGRVEVTASDGSKCSWGPGEAFLATDEGKGKAHGTRVVGGAATMLIVPLGADVDLNNWQEDLLPCVASNG